MPAAGLLLQGFWAILLTFSGTYSQLLDYVIFAALLFVSGAHGVDSELRSA